MTKKELKLQLMGWKSLQNLWEEIQKWMWWTVEQTSLIKEGYLTPVSANTPDPAHAAGSDSELLDRLFINTAARSQPAAAACYMFVPWHGACGLDSLLTFTALPVTFCPAGRQTTQGQRGKAERQLEHTEFCFLLHDFCSIFTTEVEYIQAPDCCKYNHTFRGQKKKSSASVTINLWWLWGRSEVKLIIHLYFKTDLWMFDLHGHCYITADVKWNKNKLNTTTTADCLCLTVSCVVCSVVDGKKWCTDVCSSYFKNIVFK